MYAKLIKEVMNWLSENPMSLKEISEEFSVEEKKVYRALSSLLKDKRIISFRDEDGVRRYRPVEELH